MLAIFWGALGAIVFRIALAVAATELLRLPFLQAIGGVLLIGIAIRLLLPEGDVAQRERRASERLLPAVMTILLADVTMSLDNIIAVGGLAHGNISLLVGGLILSMALLFVASAVIARLIETLTWLLDLAAIVLAITAANLISEDAIVSAHIPAGSPFVNALRVGCVVLVLGVDVVLRLRRVRQRRMATATPVDGEQESQPVRR